MDAAIAVTTDTNTREELVKLRDEIQNLITLTEGEEKDKEECCCICLVVLVSSLNIFDLFA